MIVYVDTEPADPLVAPGKGPVGADYAFIGMAPSPNRPKERINEPFGAASYKVLQAILEPGDLQERVYVTNLVKTPVPAGDKLKIAQIRRFYPQLLAELDFIGVKKRVLALGSPVAEVLCPGFTSMREDHGTIFWNPELQLYVVPTYHFSATGRDPSLKTTLLRDLDRFFNLRDPKEPPRTLVSATEAAMGRLPVYQAGERVYLDIETRGLGMGKEIFAVGWAGDSDDGETNYQLRVPSDPNLQDDYADGLVATIKALKESKVTLVGHGFTFDLARLNFNTGVRWQRPVIDTMLVAKVAGEDVLALKHLQTKYTNRPGSRAFGNIESPSYLSEDVLGTRDVLAALEKNYPGVLDRPAVKLLNKLVPVVAVMQARGVPINRGRLNEIRNHVKSERASAVTRLHEMAGTKPGLFNWNADRQVAQALISSKVPLRVRTKKTGQFSVAEGTLEPLRERYPIVDLLLTTRDFKKQDEFLEKYWIETTDDHPYLHPTLKLHGADTGRLSCAEPNLQQVPRIGPIKLLFIARWTGGKIWIVDLSQAELRIAALLSNDRALMEMLLTDDVHLSVAARVLRKPRDQVTKGERKKIKGIVFGLLYGGTPEGLAARVGVPVKEVAAILVEVFSLFPNLARYIQRIGNNGVRQGYVESITGRHRDLRAILLREGEQGAKRKAVNTPIQGLASDTMLYILDAIAAGVVKRKMKARPMFPVHDSTIGEAPPGEDELMMEVMAEAFQSLNSTVLATLPMWGDLPMLGDAAIGETWAHVESTNEENYAPDITCGFSNMSPVPIDVVYHTREPVAA